MLIACPAMGAVPETVIDSWLGNAWSNYAVEALDATEGEAAGFLTKLQQFHRDSKADLLCYLHADLTIHSRAWDLAVLYEFEDPSVAVVGFVGAMELGQRDIYKIPYDYRQLARADVWSNLTDWQSHGSQLLAQRDCAVLDSCAVIVRRSFLDRIGGWEASGLPNNSHCTDLWISLMAARYGLRTRVIPVSCTHTGGGKGEAGSSWLEARGGDQAMHRTAHEIIYEGFRGELPLRVRSGR